LLRSPLLHFLLIGALLVVLQSVYYSRSESFVVEVLQSEIDERVASFQKQIGRRPSPAEALSVENQVIENALWLEQARALGLHETDTVVRQRLVLNMRFLEGQTDTPDSELFERAISLGMDQSDTVVRRRLIDRVQAMIRAGVRSRTPDEALLEAHFEKTADRWREPALLDLTHVYFSRDKRGAAAEADAAALLVELAKRSVEPSEAAALADPFLSGHRLLGATPNRIVARFGPAFAAAVENQPTAQWVGPIQSAFGAHLVWIEDRIESRIPALIEVRKRVLEDWIAEETRKALQAQIERRKRVVEVRIIDDRKPVQSAIADDPTSLGSGS